VSKWPPIRLYLFALVRTAVHRLHFARLPTRPEQSSGFLARQPTVTGKTSAGKDHAHDTAVQAFFAVVIDGCPQVLKVAPGAARRIAPLDVLAAGFAVYVCQLLAAPKFIETREPAIQLRLPCLPRTAVVSVNGKHIGNISA
jgi:hypothetical protein